jgi:hypothetical protein
VPEELDQLRRELAAAGGDQVDERLEAPEDG